MKIRFTPRAARDLQDIADYIRAHSPGAAQRVRSAILASIQTIRSFPHAGRAQTIAGVRKLVTRKYRYLVYYSIDDALGDVVVLAIRHPARERQFEDT
jgi:toxin ParE1/3/4